MATFFFFVATLTACKGANSEEDKEASRKSMSVGELLCIYTPMACDGGKLSRLYAADPGTIYQRRLGERTLYIPIGFVSGTDLLVDPRYPDRTSDLYLLGLLPDLTPRTPDNVREFFTPYERSAVRILVGIPNVGAMPWPEVVTSTFDMTLHAANSPTRRADKFGLEVWGEDFEKWPKRRPCANAGEDEPPCGAGHTRDALRPIKPNGPPSVMECDPDILIDIDAQVTALSSSEREAYFVSRKWFGRRRAMCTHRMLYEPWDARITLQYPRRFIAQWRQTEQKVRALLDSVQRPPQTPPPAVWRR